MRVRITTWLSGILMAAALAGTASAQAPTCDCQDPGEGAVVFSMDVFDTLLRPLQEGAFEIGFDTPTWDYPWYQYGPCQILVDCEEVGVEGYWWSNGDFCSLAGYNITQWVDGGWVSIYGYIWDERAYGWAVIWGVDGVPNGVYYTEGEAGCCDGGSGGSDAQ